MYKIEITADTLAELSGKVMTLAAKLNTGAATERPIGKVPELGMGYHQKIEAPFIPLDPVMPEVAEMAAVDPIQAPKSAPAAEASESQPTTPEPSSTPAAAPSASELDFDTDVAPFVLQVVKEKGKPVAQEILSQFGVEKASSLDPAQWPELVATLKAAL